MLNEHLSQIQVGGVGDIILAIGSLIGESSPVVALVVVLPVAVVEFVVDVLVVDGPTSIVVSLLVLLTLVFWFVYCES